MGIQLIMAVVYCDSYSVPCLVKKSVAVLKFEKGKDSFDDTCNSMAAASVNGLSSHMDTDTRQGFFTSSGIDQR